MDNGERSTWHAPKIILDGLIACWQSSPGLTKATSDKCAVRKEWYRIILRFSDSIVDIFMLQQIRTRRYDAETDSNNIICSGPTGVMFIISPSTFV